MAEVLNRLGDLRKKEYFPWIPVLKISFRLNFGPALYYHGFGKHGHEPRFHFNIKAFDLLLCIPLRSSKQLKITNPSLFKPEIFLNPPAGKTRMPIRNFSS